MPRLLFLPALLLALAARAEDEEIPRHQDRPPNKPYSADDAARRMKVPPGFAVEVVAAEPDLLNPVAMTFDERGRVWVTESFEYPRREPGPGRDRVKVLEDTDGDGKADKFTVFADGLNIPSGIAVGHGGVWVANSPDILFFQDTDGDGKADKKEVVVTGFGRYDTHELPNSLTWGPDGWLYGWNGVFNDADIKYRGKEFKFNCAIFRIHPKTREFQVFCEGVSNPWGIAFNTEGEAFSSACVIDHLWHLTESNYYIRQGGPYPPFTWPSPSIVNYLHQKAAYCGITYFDSPAYPPEYRDRLILGNIHGNCLNVDVPTRAGSTFTSKPADDFLSADDAWFMPVVQKTGPDGSLYVLDWYDRYHCYQDANRDPAGVDRLKGRLYRVRYKDTPRAPRFDLAADTDAKLIQRLGDPNIYFRETAQRILSERGGKFETRHLLETAVFDRKATPKGRRHALWALIGSGPLTPDVSAALLTHEDPVFRAWAVRAAGNEGKVAPSVREQVLSKAADPSASVRLQVAIAARKLEGVDPIPVLTSILAGCGDDALIPHVVWQNLHPLLDTAGDRFASAAAKFDLKQSPALAALMPRVLDRLLGRQDPDPAPLAALLATLLNGPRADTDTARACLAALAAKVQTGEIAGARKEALRTRLAPTFAAARDRQPDGNLTLPIALLQASWKDPAGIATLRKLLDADALPPDECIQAIDALISAGDPSCLTYAGSVLTDGDESAPEDIAKVLAALGRFDEPKVADVVLAAYPKLAPELKPRGHRTPDPALPLEPVPAGGRRPQGDFGRRPQRQPGPQAPGQQGPGTRPGRPGQLGHGARGPQPRPRGGRRPHEGPTGRPPRRREAGPRRLPEALCPVPQDLRRGAGGRPGPDRRGAATRSRRCSPTSFDPSLVIGAAYQATTVATKDGRVLTGLRAEDSPRRVVLRIQGGKTETIPRDDVDELKVSPSSLMPEGLETQLTEREWSDLFAFLCLDKSPSDPSAQPIPGTPGGSEAPRP